jgi:hypothetical protein
MKNGMPREEMKALLARFDKYQDSQIANDPNKVEESNKHSFVFVRVAFTGTRAE